MHNKYLQIFLTYVTNWRRLPLAMLLLVCVLFSIASATHSPNYMGFAFLLFYPTCAIIAHLKQQIASPQASILPNYRIPHLVVAGLLVFVTLVLPPVVASRVGYKTTEVLVPPSVEPLTAISPPTTPRAGMIEPVWRTTSHNLFFFPLFSLALAGAAWLSWLIYKNSMLMAVLAVPAMFADDAEPFHRFLTQFTATPFSAESLLLFAAALAAFAALARSFLFLTEEMPDYHRANGFAKIASRNSLRINGSSPDYASRWQQFISAPSERLINGLAYHVYPSFSQRINRWRAVGSNAHAMRTLGFIIAIPSLMLAFFLTKNVSLVLPLLWILPAPLIIGIAYRRSQLFGYQSLYPLSRGRFLAEQAFVLACEWAQVWLAMAFTTVAATAILSDTNALGLLFLNLAISASGQIFLFALIVWLLRFASFRLLTIPLMPIAFMAFPMEKIFARSIGIHAFLIAMLSLLLLSALILYDAYRRWLLTDLA